MNKTLILAIVSLVTCSCKENRPEKPITSENELKYASEMDSTKPIEPKRAAHKNDDTLIVVTGKRDIQSVEKEIKNHLISVQFWYHRKYGNLDEKRRITISFTIDELGVPHQPKLVSTDMNDSLFVQKVIDDISLWRFAKYPHGSDTTAVIYPITLRPGSQPQE